MTHDELHADLPLLALGSLDPEERRVIEQHLAAGCETCTRELADWNEVVGLLPLGAEGAAAPDLKPALLARIRAARRARVVALRPSVWVPLAAAAMLLLVLNGVLRDARLREELSGRHTQIAALRAQLGDARDEIERLAATLHAKENDVSGLRVALAAAHETLDVVQTRGLRLARLAQTPDALPADGHVLISAQSGRALFYAFDLQPVSPDRVYELWWITEKAGPVNAGLFQIDARGLGRLETIVPSNLGAIEAAAVTIEPAGGRAKPSGPMVLLGSLKAS